MCKLLLHHKALSHYNVLDEVGLKALSHYNVLEKYRLTFMKSGRTQTNVGKRLRSQEVRQMIVACRWWSSGIVGERRGSRRVSDMLKIYHFHRTLPENAR